MFTINFFYFLKGYVIIEGSGKSVYELINRCSMHGIRIFNVTGGETVRFTVSRKDFFELARLARESRTKIKIVKKCGIKHLMHKYRKRKWFAAGAAAFTLFFFVSSQFLWDIEVEGEDYIKREEVLGYLAEIGVKPGKPLFMLPDAMTVKEKLMLHFDNVPWAWIYYDGVRATVSLKEGTVPPIVVDEDIPCDVVASRDGFIVSTSVKRGMEIISPGNAVNAGETVISGTVEVGPEDNRKSYSVHAEGEVYALTHYEETKQYLLSRDYPDFTGRRKNTYTITVFSKTFNLFSEPDYDYCVKHSEVFSPDFLADRFNFGITCNVYEEAEKKTEPLPAEWVTEAAKRDLSAIIASKLSPGARLRSEEYIVNETSSGLTVTAKMDFIENIGTTVPGT